MPRKTTGGYRRHGRGTLVLDIQIQQLGKGRAGRINRASGTNDQRKFQQIKAMIHTLRLSGRIDVLRAIKDGVVTPLEVWDRFRTNELDRIPSADVIRPLRASADRWIAHLGASAKHIASIRSTFKQLGIGPRSTLKDLPALLRAYKDDCHAAATHRKFNIGRSHVQAFLRDTLGRRHYVYQDVQDIQTLKVERGRRPRITPDELKAVASQLPATHRNTLWGMALTGMGVTEFWGRWELLSDRVLIHGTKREGRERMVPRLRVIVKPQTLYKAFRGALSKASDGRIKPYDLRRCFARWLEDAGVTRTRRRIYLGHKVQDITDLYEDFAVEGIEVSLADDAARLRTYLGEAICAEMVIMK